MTKRRSTKSTSAAKTVEDLLENASPELIASVERILKQNEQAFSILCIEDSLNQQPCIAFYTNGLDGLVPRVV